MQNKLVTPDVENDRRYTIVVDYQTRQREPMMVRMCLRRVLLRTTAAAV